ncbi:MAG: hypothetical protein ACJASB_002355 [Shewanella psychromarinicola]
MGINASHPSAASIAINVNLHGEKGAHMNRVNVSIDTEKVAQLIKAGHLCAAELQCLDRTSKQTIWQLCLWSCQKRFTCHNKQCQQPSCKPSNAIEHCMQQLITDEDIAKSTYSNIENSYPKMTTIDADK